MFQDLNNNDNKTKTIKLMVFSAIAVTILFVYIFMQNQIQSTNTNSILLLSSIFVLAITLAYRFKLKDKINNTKQQQTTTQQNTNDKYDNTMYIEPTTTDVKFSDIAGIDEVKSELTQVVEFLNKPEKYLKYGVSLPKGVLLVGPPGVGKTMIAKAVANEADVPFYYQSGASFVHIYVGMGAKKVRELFSVAKANSPSIIFIDEIDAIGKSRGVSGNDEREATLNELLTQMDGFDDKSTVMVIAATNKIELLDEALLRAGRFDRTVYLQLPNKEDRLKILTKSCENRKFNFDIEKLASDTAGFNSAALVTLINEALLNMIQRSGTSILEDDIVSSKQKLQYGKKQIKILNEEQKDILATYQASKAFIIQKRVKLLEEGIVFDDLIYPSKTQLQNQILALLAGSVGVLVIKNDEHIVFDTEIDEAYKIANLITNKYRLSTQTIEQLILEIKGQLTQTISSNKDEILLLKDKLLKDEFVF
jgi:ATP-dependent metalloprotease FtsH